VAALWGLAGGAVAWALARLWSQPQLALAVLAAMPLVLVMSAVLGTVVPLLLWRVGVDPALARRPVITVAAALAALPVYAVFAQWAVR
jgi:magnesium transporter